MSIEVQCGQCGAKRKVNERLAGRVIRCPGCEQPLKIPAVVATEPVSPDQASVGKSVEETAVFGQSASNTSSSAAESTGAAARAIGGSGDPISASNGDTASGNGVSMATLEAASGRGADVSGRGAGVTDPPSIPPNNTGAAEPAARSDEDDDDDGVPPRQKREDGELDMTPMVDVTFLLLIFFMVTASFSLQKSIQMPRQSSDLPSMSNVEEETEELDPVELEIDETGAFLVLAPEWERETPGKQNLTTALKEAIGDNRDGMKLDIKVHENAKLQMLVDGMDAGTIAGFTQIQVTEVDGFD